MSEPEQDYPELYKIVTWARRNGHGYVTVNSQGVQELLKLFEKLEQPEVPLLTRSSVD